MLGICSFPAIGLKMYVLQSPSLKLENIAYFQKLAIQKQNGTHGMVIHRHMN